MIKAVIFDLDDTLFPEAAFQKSGRRFIASYLTRQGFPVSEKEIEMVYADHPRDCFDELIKIYQLPIEVKELVRLFREHSPDIQTYPGVMEVLEKLKGKYQLGILTDYYHATQQHKIQALGIEHYFSHIIYTDRMGTSKPDTAPFEEMKRRMHCGPREIMYVGDNEQKDFIGARHAGYYTVKYEAHGVYKDQHVDDPMYRAEFEIQNHSELLTILHTLTPTI